MFDPSKWAGRKFRCMSTGVEIVIPDDVCRGQFFSFGASFIDVDDGYYSRSGGFPEEIFKDGSFEEVIDEEYFLSDEEYDRIGC